MVMLGFSQRFLVKIVWPWKFRPRSWSTTFAMVPFDGKYQPVWNPYLSSFSLALTVFEIFTFQNVWPWKYRSSLWRTTFAMAKFNGKCSNSDMMTIVLFSLSFTVYEIFAVNKNDKTVLENEGQGQRVEKGNCTIWLKIVECVCYFLRILATWQ